MLTSRVLAASAALVIAVSPRAEAQSPAVLLDEGIAAYRDVDLVAAARLLRRALEAREGAALNDAQRQRALMYLGAAEHLARAEDRAAAAFRELILLNPGFRPDTMVFPPPVTATFRRVLGTTKAAALTVPERHTFVPGQAGYPVTVTVTSSQFVTLQLERPDGGALVTLMDDRVDDSVTVQWDGRDADGRVVPEGRFVLRAVSSAAPCSPLRWVAVPIAIEQRTLAPRPIPAFPRDSLRPERTGGGLRLELGAPLIGLGTLIWAPPVLADVDHAAPRIVIGGGLTVGGLVALLSRGRGKPIPENIAFNRELRRRHERRVAAVERANARRGEPELTIRAGAVQRGEIQPPP